MSSREIAEEMGIVPETVGTTDNMSESKSLASGSGHSRTKNPEEPVRYRDLVSIGLTGCCVVMTQKGAKRVCGYPRSICRLKNHTQM